MNNLYFNGVVDERIQYIKDSLQTKGSEYAPGNDRLENFKTAGALLGQTPEMYLINLVTKHYVALTDFVRQLEGGRLKDYPFWEEKIGDVINYMILLDALIIERRNEKAGQRLFGDGKWEVNPDEA